MHGKELWEARQQAMIKNHDLRSLQTIVGRHAARLVDLAEAPENKKNAIVAELGGLANMWANVLLNNNVKGDDDNVDYKFREAIHESVMEFTKDTINAKVPELNNAVNVYRTISPKAGRYFDNIQLHLQEYVSSIYRMRQYNPGTENFERAATHCIWNGIRLGTYLDMVLYAEK